MYVYVFSYFHTTATIYRYVKKFLKTYTKYINYFFSIICLLSIFFIDKSVNEKWNIWAQFIRFY